MNEVEKKTDVVKDNFDKCVELASEIITNKGYKIDPTVQVQNIFNYASTDDKFKLVITSTDQRVLAELRSQIKFVCELGLDTAKGRKLVYVKTRGVNIGTRQQAQWLTVPDITISYHALIHVLIRSKALKHITVLHTYQNYDVEYTGALSDVPVVRSWKTSPSERGEYTGVFVILTLASGETETSFYHLKDILATHKAFSKSSQTWDAHKLAMVAKSAIMEAIRYIPVFDNTVATVIEDYDQSHDWGSVKDVSEDSRDEMTDDRFNELFSQWEDSVNQNKFTIPQLLENLKKKTILNELQIKKIKGIKNAKS